MLLDRSFPQFFTIGDLFDDSMVLQLLPAVPGAGLLSDPRSPLSVPAPFASASEVIRRTGRWPDCSRMRSASPRSTDLC